VKVLILPDAAAAAARVAGILADAVRARPGIVLGLATGETMRPVYECLARLHDEGRVDFSGASTFNLDEYVGVAADHPASFAAFMDAEFFSRVNLGPARHHLPRGDAPDPEEEARRYEGEIAAAGGIDLQLLGIGRNGHLAFNEPTSSLASRTRIKTLTEATRSANAPAFAPGPVPRQAITMGIGTILEARACVLLATGAAKAAAVARMIEGPLGADCPATALQMHPQATVVLDDDSAGNLRHREYYQRVHPGGQEAPLD
jgi:glucosamine-6-phosphate deaminase